MIYLYTTCYGYNHKDYHDYFYDNENESFICLHYNDIFSFSINEERWLSLRTVDIEYISSTFIIPIKRNMIYTYDVDEISVCHKIVNKMIFDKL